MEIITILFIVLLAIVFMKILAFSLHVGIALLTLPLKLLAVAFASVVVAFVLVPLGVVAGLVGIFVLPFALAIPLLPVLLVLGGLWLLFRVR